MRNALLALVSTIALIACSPTAPADGGGEGASQAQNDTGPPQATGVSFRQEATLIIPNGPTMPQVLIHDGNNVRTETNGPGGAMINIMNSERQEAISIIQMGGRTIATRTDLSQVQNTASVTPDQIAAYQEQARARSNRVGTCSAAGETGTEWSMGVPEGAPEGTGAARTICITSDGIMIQMKQNGQLVFDTQSLQRGPQNPSLFQVPPGVEVRDAPTPNSAAVAAAIERAKARAAGQ